MSALGFRHELEKLINRESMENGSNTPDFILASYLFSCLKAYDLAVRAREHWFGRQGHSLKDPAQETAEEYVQKPTFQRKCWRCGKLGPSATPENGGVYFCSHACAD